MAPAEARRQALIQLGGSNRPRKYTATGAEFLCLKQLFGICITPALATQQPGIQRGGRCHAGAGSGREHRDLQRGKGGVAEPTSLSAAGPIGGAGRERFGGDPRPETIGYATAYDWRRLSHSFESMSLYRDGSTAMVERGESELVHGIRVNFDFFDTLGVRMELGRAFLTRRRPSGYAV